ncbi:MAG TPA: hypothetical protein VG944_08585 [Fimbriimonas sp.]|nr:hypothetical protein [Fimbriimonas sp.]
MPGLLLLSACLAFRPLGGNVHGEEVHADGGGFSIRLGDLNARIDLSSEGLVFAGRVKTRENVAEFDHLASRAGVTFSPDSSITVQVLPGDPFPTIRFNLTIVRFDPLKWEAAAGKAPFHFLTLSLPGAEVWHQGGWLNATPLVDPFPLLQDRHAGTPEISGFTYNRNWSNTIPLGGQPVPVIGLWAPRAKQYVGLDFGETRIRDNSERDVATGYCWKHGGSMPAQFVSLVYPYGGEGFQKLVFPKDGAQISSSCRLIWSDNLPSTDDPNRLFFEDLWKRNESSLPRVPAAVDLSWLPGGVRLSDFEGPPNDSLIKGPEKPFETDDAQLIDGWRWQYENPVLVAARNGDRKRLAELEATARELAPMAIRFEIGGDPCVYWDKPLKGSWVADWGGPAVQTTHNANGFAAGRVFLGLGLTLHNEGYLKIARGVYNWAKHVVWTRNEFADVPSSPFAIGGTLPTSFCLEYAAYLDSFDPKEAQRARDLARSFTYRYMVAWPGDNNRFDGLDSSFLWEPNSGRDWTAAACSNEVFWNLDTLAQTAVETGDPILSWMLQGSLSRWAVLYQEKYRPSLAAYRPEDMTEGFGLYPGSVYGFAQRAPYGFSSPLDMIEPVGSSVVRVLAGRKAAMAFDKNGVHSGIQEYKFTSPGNFEFTMRSLKSGFDLSLTEPYADLHEASVQVLRDGKEVPIDVVRPKHAPWSLMLKGLDGADRIVVGHPLATASLPSLPPLIQGQQGLYVPPKDGSFQACKLPYDSFPDMSWEHLDSWAGLPRGVLWSYGVEFALPPNGGRSVVTKPVRFQWPIQSTELAVAYSAGDGPSPTLLCSDGTRLSGSEEVLAWRAWPPIYTQKLLAARYRTGGRQIVGIDPGSRKVWAVSYGTPSSEVVRAWSEGQEEWEADVAKGRSEAALAQQLGTIRPSSIALLPPDSAGPMANLIGRVGATGKLEALSNDDLVSGKLNSSRVALYTAGEEYVDTVRTPFDGGKAIEDFLASGGTLVLTAAGPYPMYYATGPGEHNADPLPPKLGLPIQIPFETPPEELYVQVQKGLPAGFDLSKAPARYPMPSTDPRLRSIDSAAIKSGSQYYPIARIVGASGKSYGDAAGLVVLPGGGRILYLWSGLTRDPKYGPSFARAALAFAFRAAKR